MTTGLRNNGTPVSGETDLDLVALGSLGGVKLGPLVVQSVSPEIASRRHDMSPVGPSFTGHSRRPGIL